MLKIDLHLHTTASDGSDTPAELLALAQKKGLDVISITDHDTLAGSLEAIKMPYNGVKVITGIEFSCHFGDDSGFDCHILGYGFDPEDRALTNAIDHGRQMRLVKLEARLGYLRDVHGIEFGEEDISYLHSLNSVARPHLARLLMKDGYVSGIAEAFDRYLGGDGFPDDRIDAGEAISAILSAGGVPVYAHPIGGEREKRLTRSDLEARVDMLVPLGLKGLECYYSRYSREESEMISTVACSHGLLLSAGSDYHGGNKTVVLGCLSSDGSDVDIDPSIITVINGK